MIDVEKNYEQYLKYLSVFVKREGIENLIKWFEKTDIKTAPASSKYHLSCDGGLIQHSLNVFNRLIGLMNKEYGEPDNFPYSKETIAIVALLHDISKVNFYKPFYRNVQNQETGIWEKVRSFVVRDEEERLNFASHQENSLYLISKFLNLSYEEELAIRYHMGCIDCGVEERNRMIYAYKKSPLALLLHLADMEAMCLDEDNEGNRNKNDVKEKEINAEQNTVEPSEQSDGDIPF